MNYFADAKCSNQEKADVVKKAGGIGIIILSQASGVGVFGTEIFFRHLRKRLSL